MEPTKRFTPITRLEITARSIQISLRRCGKGRWRNVMVSRLALVDQIMARRKDRDGCLGTDAYAYLDD